MRGRCAPAPAALPSYASMPMNRPLCFILMPFGRKDDSSGRSIDFDAVYRDLIKPAVEAAGLDPLRADEEEVGGIIHKPMFERLVLCEYAVADLTTANANVFYELGVRHAVRPWSTVLLYAEGTRLPFDVAPLRALPYEVAPDGTPQDTAAVREALAERLRAARRAAHEHPAGVADSPLYQLLEDYPEIQHEKTDVFREQVTYARGLKERIAAARKAGLDALRDVERSLGDFDDTEAGVVIDLFLSYRDLKAWGDMEALALRMPAPLAATVLVREQRALALNRAGDGEGAEQILKELLDQRGPSSETYGLLGRVYKDRWEAADKGGDKRLARGLLDQAIAEYLRGFEADWRDAYPGVNAVTLMELREPPDARQAALLPVVRYAVERRVAGGRPDYWDHATLLELAVLARDEAAAEAALADALPLVRAPWEPETTARNLRLIREARERRGEEAAWLRGVEDDLAQRAA